MKWVPGGQGAPDSGSWSHLPWVALLRDHMVPVTTERARHAPSRPSSSRTFILTSDPCPCPRKMSRGLPPAWRWALGPVWVSLALPLASLLRN